MLYYQLATHPSCRGLAPASRDAGLVLSEEGTISVQADPRVEPEDDDTGKDGDTTQG